MTEDEIVARADANYYASMSTLVCAIDGAEVRIGDGLHIVRSGMPVPWLNIAFVTRPLRDARAQIAAAIAYFDGHGLPFIVRMREGIDPAVDEAALPLGISYHDSVPGLVLAQLSDVPALPDRLEVRTATDPDELQRHAHLIAASFEMPLALARNFLSVRLLDAPDTEFYVGYVDGKPAACSALVVSHGVAGVYNVGCAPEYRRQGFGEAMTWHAVRRGAEIGCAMASLQASEMGRQIYERMGFRLVAQYRTFIRQA